MANIYLIIFSIFISIVIITIVIYLLLKNQKSNNTSGTTNQPNQPNQPTSPFKTDIWTLDDLSVIRGIVEKLTIVFDQTGKEIISKSKPVPYLILDGELSFYIETFDYNPWDPSLKNRFIFGLYYLYRNHEGDNSVTNDDDNIILKIDITITDENINNQFKFAIPPTNIPQYGGLIPDLYIRWNPTEYNLTTGEPYLNYKDSTIILKNIKLKIVS